MEYRLVHDIRRHGLCLSFIRIGYAFYRIYGTKEIKVTSNLLGRPPEKKLYTLSTIGRL